MAYGLAQCGSCKRPRIIDLSKKASVCPYCGTESRTDMISIFYRSESQEAVREALAQATGFVPPDALKKREKIAEADPYSTMVYRYEHCSDLNGKMLILAEGLTEIKGTFTMEDVREIAGDRAEKMVSAMLDRCIIFEVRHGVYKA
ncbi:MAG: hypothetical protein IKP20_02135 [Candidatus Methanomethylophilaceae archaeon]|nr:hypothetical protein [Candidatus Methanomethylophilaceae archaeon]